jgi:hypothetical protein
VLWERSVVEQRSDAVREVLGGRGVTEVAARYGVSRQSVYTWVGRYRAGGLAGLSDRSHRPNHSPDRPAPRSRRPSASCGGGIRAGARRGLAGSWNAPGWGRGRRG